MALLWLRNEIKSNESRVAIVPAHAKVLIELGHTVVVEASSSRCFSDQEYLEIGCELVESDSWERAPEDAVIVGLKYINDTFELKHRHVYFAHAYNENRNYYEKPQVKSLLDRLVMSKGEHYDLEFLVDDNNQRVCAFGEYAGLAGALAGIVLYHCISKGMTCRLPTSLDDLFEHREQITRLLDDSRFSNNRVLVIGKGRCARGVCRLLDEYNIHYDIWGREETKHCYENGGMLNYGIVFNCIAATDTTGVFIDRKSLFAGQALKLIIDIGCETNDNNPIKLYEHTNSFDNPVHQVTKNGEVVHVMAIDNLPSLIPKTSSRAFSSDFLPHLSHFLQGNTGTVWENASFYFENAMKRHIMRTDKVIFLIQDARFNRKIDFTQLNIKENNIVLILYYQTEDHEQVVNQYSMFRAVISLSDIVPDLDKIESVVKEYLQKNQISQFKFVTSAEAAVPVCGLLSVRFGVDDDDMLRFNDKIVMKQVLQDKVRIPRHFLIPKCNPSEFCSRSIYDKALHSLGKAFFIKPTDQYSSIGTKKVESFEDFVEIECFIGDMNFEADEFVNGKLFHVDSFFKNGEMLFSTAFEYLYPCYEFLKGKPLGSCMLHPDSALFKELCDFNDSIFDSMAPPRNGMTHMEVFQKNDGELVFLEVAARPSGALVPEVFEKSFGIRIREEHLKLCMYETYSLDLTLAKYACFVSYPIKKGIVSQITLPNLNSEFKVYSHIQIGDDLSSLVSKISDTAISIVLWNDDYQLLNEDFLHLATINLYTTR